MKEQIHNREIEDPWEALNKALESWNKWKKALESNEHVKKEVAPGLTFICNELESDIVEK